MQDMWGYGDDDGQAAESFDQLGRVVPADGDPEVEHYRASLRARERPRRGLRWLRGRHAVRNWTITLAVLALIVLFIKPLVVFAAVAAAAVLGLILFGLLIAGALLLAARFALGGRLAYHAGRTGTYRRTTRWHV